ncbi:transposon Ty3-I Gag-Pol polyprotein [Trichonephila clavipes]|nr:transposon Ty3-I Gag-Pol polyprotein [Trichonephila clavipes]
MVKAEEARQLEKIHLARAQHKDKCRYDERHWTVNYKDGDLVWIFTPIRKVGLSEKLLQRYFGPFRVTKRLSEVTYEVEPCECMRSKRKLRDVVHVLRMKPYKDPDLQLEDIKQDNSPTEPVPTVFVKRIPKQFYYGPVTRSRSKQLQRIAVSPKEREMSRTDKLSGAEWLEHYSIMQTARILASQVHEQMSRFGGLSEERSSVFKTPSKLGTHLSTQCRGDERQSRLYAAR